jgi:hypothetical protein
LELKWVNNQFKQAVGKHRKTSEVDEEYNCIAWAAASNKTEWWSHGPGYKWPAPSRSPLIGSLVAVFSNCRFIDCEWDASLEAGYEKVALYERNGFWTHAARQLPSGKWTSKLGPDEDIEHDSPDCLCGEGDAYGTIHCIMRRTL